MTLDWIDVLKVAFGAVGLRIYDWLRSSLFPTPGPAFTLSRTNIPSDEHPNRVYPRVLEIENSGSETAFDATCEVRIYYDSLFPPSYSRTVCQHVAPIKPGERIRVETIAGTSEQSTPGAHGLCLADLYTFEMFLRCRDAKKRKYLAHFSIDLAGVVAHQDFCVGLIPRLFLPARVWLRHAREFAVAYTTVRARQAFHAALEWLRKRNRRSRE